MCKKITMGAVLRNNEMKVVCPKTGNECSSLGGPDPVNFPDELYCHSIKKWLNEFIGCPKIESTEGD